MTNLKDQVKEFVKPEDHRIKYISDDINKTFPEPYYFNRGVVYEQKRLSPILKLLPEIVECLENIEPKLMELAKVLKNNAKSKEQGIAEHDACLIASGFLKANYGQTLAKIKEAVGDHVE